ncbi:MAG: extracellular solute-binding protein [Firmicutes bacterium]|nr:extracellular solute-binding protein [Bacillota bacterium]
MKKCKGLAIFMIMSVLILSGCSKETTVSDKPAFHIWVPLHANHSTAGVSSFGDVEVVKELEKRTGVKVEYTTVPYITAEDQRNKFNLLLASGNLPEAFLWNNDGNTISRLAQTGVIVELTDLVNQFGDNIKKELNQIGDLKKQTIDDAGKLWNIPAYTANLEMAGGLYARLVIRKDWLDNLGLDMPNTLDEWYTVMKAFKEKDPNQNGKADEIPYSLSNGSFNNYSLALLLFNPLGITGGIYQVDGVAKYGVLDPLYKQGLEFGNKLFKEGLIDADFMSQSEAQVDKKILNNQVGIAFGKPNVRISNYKTAIKDLAPEYNAKLLNFPLSSNGERYAFNEMFAKVNRGMGLYITSKAKDPKAIMEWINYQFSDEGGRLMYYGIEGVHYDMIDNMPVYKEKVTDPKIKPTLFASCVFNWPSKDFEWSLDKIPNEILANWDNDAELVSEAVSMRKEMDISRIWPASVFYTEEELSVLNSKSTEIGQHLNEMFAKFITGEESFNKYDDFIDNLYRMGIEEVLSSHQAALDRYNNR